MANKQPEVLATASVELGSLGNVAFRIIKEAEGANGNLDYQARVASAAAALGDCVYEVLDGHDIRLDDAARRMIERIVASAMIAQHDFDDAWTRQISDDECRIDRINTREISPDGWWPSPE